MHDTSIDAWVKVSKIWSRWNIAVTGRIENFAGGRKDDNKKKDKKGVQPYAYVPLSKLRKGQGAKQVR